ncbi:hypothetical protein PG913_01620 [Tenacibaculum pacificus]|uniref:hypothetical protein n=1 Tax=Tenacibaculum pacificus TaxID=3018314 RepID=UPI0022F3A1FA|nr:hypothetical protein [Tenacibaculum pacificus]WBX73968.1 hypothetical protein PG913_01620 [Tenacibaculum pacificus]
MKKILFIFAIIFTVNQSLKAQEKKVFFTSSLNFTFSLNENYVLFNPDDGENALKFSAIFVRTGFGYKFAERWATIVNLGYDHHPKFSLNAIPIYGTLRYNIDQDDDDSFFTEASYGNIWRPSSKFEDGKYYAFGLGVQISNSSRWLTVIRLDFHRKKITNFKNGNLDSISLGLGFTFL